MKNIFYLLLLLISLNCNRHFTTTNNIEDGIKISSMAKEGINAALINSLDSAITKGVYPNIHSVLIAKNNKLVYEKYYPGMDRGGMDRRGDQMVMTIHGKDSLHALRSITKSVVSACIGIAIKQGKIKSVNQRVFDFFPEYSKLDTGWKSALTIKHLLTMSSGIIWNETVPYDNPENSETKMDASKNAVEYVLSQPIQFPPGKVWNYNGGTTHLLATIIKKATGKQVDEFADEFLFKPMGINYFKWSKLPGTQLTMGFSGLRLSSRDLLKFGLLYNNRGKWNEIQIVPAKWIEESLQSHIKREEIKARAYGYQFWKWSDTINNQPIRIVAAIGNGDQRIYFDKTHDLVVVFTAGNYNKWTITKNSYAILKDYIYPAMFKK